MISSISLPLAAILLLGATPHWEFNEAGRRDLYENADLIFIGKVIKEHCCTSELHAKGKEYGDFALAQIEIPIKGPSKAEVIFNHRAGIVDMQPDCCVEGATYLFYLKSIKGKDWYNFYGGQFSVSRISP